MRRYNFTKLETEFNFGLIGKDLSHSFSASYFKTVFERENLDHCQYGLYPISNETDLSPFLEAHKDFRGFNITTPYKVKIISDVHELTKAAEEIGAVNCIKRVGNNWIGHNTDGPAFLTSLDNFLEINFKGGALILGNGGASKAVQWALHQRGIEYTIVSRKSNFLSYHQLEENWNDSWKLIINTSTIGMYPILDLAPEIPYHRINEEILGYDLIYNPAETLFLKKMSRNGAQVKNGLEMLHLQADLSLQFWMQDV